MRDRLLVWAGSVCLAGAALVGFGHDSLWVAVPGLVLFSGGLALLLTLGVPDLRRVATAQLLRRAKEPPTELASFEKWRYTSDGVEAPSTMNALQKRSSHLDYLSVSTSVDPPWLQFAVRIACGPPEAAPTTSQLKSALLRFLEEPQIRELVEAFTYLDSGMNWTGYAGHGPRLSEAILDADKEHRRPPRASALLLFDDSQRSTGDAFSVAELSVRIDPCDDDNPRILPLRLCEWHDRLTRSITLAAMFASFLRDIGFTVSADPAPQLGFRLEASKGLSDLINTRSYESLPGSNEQRQWLGYFIADPDGSSPRDATRDGVAALCDYGLHVLGYEAELARPAPAS